jgi:hypothetical protein
VAQRVELFRGGADLRFQQIVDPRRLAVGKVALHGALEHVVVPFVRGLGRIGLRQIERAAQAAQEQLIIRALLPSLAAFQPVEVGWSLARPMRRVLRISRPETTLVR